MDTKEDKLAELKAALHKYQGAKEPEANTLASLWQTDSISWQGLTTMQIPSLTSSQITSIDLSQLTQNTVLGGTGSGGGGSGVVYTTTIGGGSGGGSGGNVNTAIGSGQHTWTTTGTSTGYNWPNQGTMHVAAQDIVVNGKSIMKTIENIEIQLGLLDHSEELEKDWKELRAAGRKYREIKKRIEDKIETFNKLKQPTKKA